MSGSFLNLMKQHFRFLSTGIRTNDIKKGYVKCLHIFTKTIHVACYSL